MALSVMVKGFEYKYMFAAISFGPKNCRHMDRLVCFALQSDVTPIVDCADVIGRPARSGRDRKACMLQAHARHKDQRLVGTAFWEALNENLNEERSHRQYSITTARFAGQLSLLPWMRNDWLNNEGFRSLHRHSKLSALHAVGGMSERRFGPGLRAWQGGGWTMARQEFAVYRPLCFDAELGFFQTNVEGIPVRMGIFDGKIHQPLSHHLSDTHILEKEISWVMGSTFASNPWDLHVPHFFWELHAMFSLGLYSSGALQFDRLLILDNAGWWNCSSYGAEILVQKLASSGAHNLSFFEEHVIAAVVSKAPTWELMPWSPEFCPQMLKENKVKCFEQVIVQLRGEDNGKTICSPGFFGLAEAALFRQHTLAAHRLQPNLNDAGGPAASEKVRMMFLQRGKMRRVQNFDALVAVATSMKIDFVVLDLEDLTYREQVRQWSMTNVVVATNGAALVNIVLMPLGSHIIEIPFRHPSGLYFVQRCFYQAHAVAIGIQFHSLCGSECLDHASVVRGTNDGTTDWLYQDITVTASMVEELSKVLWGLRNAGAFLVDGP
jgi:hypothetical protein